MRAYARKHAHARECARIRHDVYVCVVIRVYVCTQWLHSYRPTHTPVRMNASDAWVYLQARCIMTSIIMIRINNMFIIDMTVVMIDSISRTVSMLLLLVLEVLLVVLSSLLL